ncbi:hypothetical protein WMZ97_12355 [Lentibacillus sp. N15]
MKIREESGLGRIPFFVVERGASDFWVPPDLVRILQIKANLKDINSFINRHFIKIWLIK